MNREARREAAFTGRSPSYVLAVAVAAIGLVVASCATASKVAALLKRPTRLAADAELPVDAYFPLTANSWWTYRVEDFVGKLAYQVTFKVHGKRYVDSLEREGISVEGRYSSFGPNSPYVLEEQEPMLYFRENGYLNRILLTYQAGKVISASGSSDIHYLPEVLKGGESWDSSTQAFRVGDLGFKVTSRHSIVIERSTIKVAAGDFDDCVRVDTFATQPESASTGGELAFYYSDWYAPGVGLVLTRQFDDAEHEHERTQISLTNYSIDPSRGTGEASTAADASKK